MNILVEEGALPEQVDKVMVDFGYPVGPFVVSDMSGLDIGYDMRKRRAARVPELPQSADRRPHRRGRPARARRPARAGTATSRATAPRIPTRRSRASSRRPSAELGIPQQSFTDDEILKRLLFASVNEACKILDEGKALRASDIDVMWLHGFGFPRYRGGLMFWADTIGVREVYNQIAAWHQRYGDRWAPSPLAAPPRRSRHAAARGEGQHEVKRRHGGCTAPAASVEDDMTRQELDAALARLGLDVPEAERDDIAGGGPYRSRRCWRGCGRPRAQRLRRAGAHRRLSGGLSAWSPIS